MSETELSMFEFHTGFEPKPATHGNMKMTCPFCEKEDHFFFHIEKRMWDCKVCNESGNDLGFIRKWYESWNNQTTTSHTIAELRGIPVIPVQRNGVKYNEANQSFMIPTYKNGHISNLYKAVQVYDREKGKMVWRILATPGIRHQLFNYEEEYHDTIWVCEGHWDKMAAEAIVGSRPISVIAAPGAGVWDREWCKVLADKDVVFCYDNDDSGQSGFERVITKFIAEAAQKPKSISFIQWPDDFDKGFDMNDSYRKWGKGSFGQIEKLIKPYETAQNIVVVKSTLETVHEDSSCDTFDKLLLLFKDVWHTTQDMEQGLALVLASIYSVRLNSEQLWIRLIGPPGSGKTTIAKTVSGSDQVVLKSTFTGLFSGYSDDTGEDAGLIPEIKGRTLIVKDADALLRQGNVEKIFSELRDFYDKDSSVSYRNKVKWDYRNVKCTMVLCGTNVLRRADSSFLGERFLDFELRLTEDDREKVTEKALEVSRRSMMAESSITPEIPVLAGAKGFINHLLNRQLQTYVDPKTDRYMSVLADLCSKMRTKVDRDNFGRGEVTFQPVPESPTRLVQQFNKLCTVLPVVFGSTHVDERTHKILFKVVRDIIDTSSPRYRICQELIEEPCTMMALHKKTGMSLPVLSRELDNLRALNMVNWDKVSTGLPGRSALSFTLVDKLKEGLILSDEHKG